MTLLNRPPRPLGRRHRKERDDRLFLIATDDTYAPKQYFEAFCLPPRVRVHVVPTEDGRCAAADVLSRLKELQAAAKAKGDLRDDDQLWMVIDTDHFARGNHTPNFSNALKEAHEAGIEAAVSNPCFELWLLLHVAEVTTPVKDATDVANRLREALGAYNKTNIPTAQLLPHVETAIVRANGLDHGGSGSGWPQSTGTQVHLLVQQLRR